MDTRIAIAQINASSNPQQNLRTAARMATEAAQKQAHLLMLPEYTMTYPDHRLPDGVPFPGGHPQQNLRTAARMATEAAQKQAHLLMLPEYTMTYPDHRLPDGVPFPGGQPLDGPFVSGLRELAATHRLWITCGVIEQTPDNPRPYNTTVVISDQGELVASHRKCQLYDASIPTTVCRTAFPSPAVSRWTARLSAVCASLPPRTDCGSPAA